MFKKVLIADDLGSINRGVVTILDTLGVTNVQQVQYCDDAYLKIKKAELDGDPYGLLITDLSFKSDYREQRYSSGEALIEALKGEHPQLKIIVYSIEDRLQKIRHLVKGLDTDAYVCKSRRGLIELSKAVDSVYNNILYISPQVRKAISSRINLEITDFDIQLLKKLSRGSSQEDISKFFKTRNVSPSSLSSIEKHINRLKIQFKANNAIHLVAKVKDMGLI